MVKFTKSEIYETVIAMVKGEEIPTFEKKDGENTVMTEVSVNDVIDRMQRDIELANRKSSKSNELTKTQKENMALKDAIIMAMTDQPAKTIDEIKEICPKIENLSTSKISALLSQLRKTEQIERTYKNKKAYFKVK